jgi:UDP-glucose 4-epimerase
MKRILITGEKSYVGTGVERYLMEYNAKAGREEYHVDTISLREESWVHYDFSSYGTVFHVAGIAHVDTGKVSEEGKELYYLVNRDLAAKAARKAKKQGVSQFIYMSSMIVYGESAPVGIKRVITHETRPAPANFYGDSKLQGERVLEGLAGEGFNVAILRPPMIYGKGGDNFREGKGNYAVLSKMAGKFPVFPKIKNERSVLYMENLGEFVRLLTESGRGGFFFPQNGEYCATAQMVEAIGRAKGKNVRLWKILNPMVYLAAKFPGKIGKMANKAFGNMIYAMDMGEERMEGLDGYQLYSLEESISRAEK